MTPARLGYTEREWAFLRLASLLSGYFLRRHFNEFIGKECGAVGQRFLERGVSLNHFKVIPALAGRVIYHAAGSRLYEALEDENSRNRRSHRTETIRRRLMAMDYALREAGIAWLLSESHKVAHFEGLGIPKSDLPAARFVGRAGAKTQRFFVDKQPLGLSPSGTYQLCFVDEGTRTLSQWELFLKNHRALLQRLGEAEVVFASRNLKRFAEAASVFRRVIAGQTAEGAVDLERLKSFFVARKAAEEKRFDLFDQAKLDELRENRRVFCGEQFDSLYRDWLAGKPLPGLRQNRLRLTKFALPHRYDWLSPFRT